MTNLKELLDRIRENELTAQRFQKVENKILSILNYKDLFEALLSEIMVTFKVPYVWISFIDGTDISDTILRFIDSSPLLNERVNIISESLFRGLFGDSTLPVLINQDLKPYFKMLPENRKYFIRSMAIAPITLDGNIIGSLNQGDSDSTRFDPDFDTSLLEQLAKKVSLCLSNVTAHEKLKFLAFHDPLTELLNRRVMESVLNRELQRTKRYSGVLSLTFIDLDDFKKVNDTNGHEAGDLLLKYVAGKLLELTRETDTVARFAGDEFVVILPETDEEMARILLGRIQSFFEENPFIYNGHSIPVSISFGVTSTVDESLNTPELILKKADHELYQEKLRKKCVVCDNSTTT